MSIHWKAVERYFTVALFCFTQVVILENLSVLDLALPGVKRLTTAATCFTSVTFDLSHFSIGGEPCRDEEHPTHFFFRKMCRTRSTIQKRNRTKINTPYIRNAS